MSRLLFWASSVTCGRNNLDATAVPLAQASRAVLRRFTLLKHMLTPAWRSTPLKAGTWLPIRPMDWPSAVGGPLSHIACGWYGLPNSQGVGCFHDCRSCFVRPQGANDLHDCRFRLGPQGPTTSCRSSPFETTRANDVKPFFVGRGHSATGPTTFVFALKHPYRQVYLDVALHSHWGRVYTL